MNIRSILVIWLVLLAVATFAQAGNRWALLVGVNDYANLEDLKFCGDDMAALKRQLVQSGFQDEQIFLIQNGAKDAKYLPFKDNITKQFDLVLGLAEDDDVIVVAYSGHGLYLDGRTYLCPAAADPSRRETLIPLDELYSKLKTCRASLKLVVVDACRNDPRPSGQKSATPKQDLVRLGKAFERPPEGIVLLASCAPGEVSMESPDFKHGVFINFLLEGLGGAADDNRDQKVSISEAARYAGTKTKVYVARRFNSSQRPYVTGDLSADVLDYPLAAEVTRGEFTNSIGMKLVRIPAGELLMGSPESEDGHRDDEQQHRVKISQPFYLGAHEVTIGQFRRFVEAVDYQTEPERDGEGGYGDNATTNQSEGRKPQYTWRNTGFTQTGEHPVVNVTWNDAQAFCRWLSGKEGRTYRLPTEAEWEYACRAGSRGRYAFGDDPEGLARVGNVADRTAQAKFSGSTMISARDGYVFTAPVGKFVANAFGLYDMHGNVYEWCQDWYDEDYYAKSPGVDPRGPTTGSSRVLRGGSWNYNPYFCRSADRSGKAPDHRHYYIGFRVLVE